MSANPDFKNLFSIFNEEAVEYLVVGAHAVIYFTEPRYTKDLNVLVNSMQENARRVYWALKQFGAPLKNISESDFADKELIYQVGIEPNRIDVIMSVAGVEFAEAWEDRVETSYAGVPIFVMGKDSLIRAKTVFGRQQDHLDLDRLTQLSA